MARTISRLALATLAATASLGVIVGCDDTRAAPSFRLTPADEAKASGAKGADPTPKAGTLVLGRQSLELARAAIASTTVNDPVKVTVLSFGRDSDGSINLNFTVKNTGACTVTALFGVAYGFDARGHASAVNAGGERYVAFAVDKQAIPKGETARLSVPLHNVPKASIGVAHVDTTTCDDGTKWARP